MRNETPQLDLLRTEIVRRAARLGLQRADAEDVAQTILLRLLTGQSPGDDDVAKAWAWRVTFNAVVDYLRLVRRRRVRERVWSDLPRAPVRDPESQAMANRATECVDALPEGPRTALTLCLAEGLSHRAAAQILGVPLGTVKTRVRSGLASARLVLTSTERPCRSMPPASEIQLVAPRR